MTVRGLWSLLRKRAPEAGRHVPDWRSVLQGKRVAMDVAPWLYQRMNRQRSNDLNCLLEELHALHSLFQEAGVSLVVYIFDGVTHPAKRAFEHTRRAKEATATEHRTDTRALAWRALTDELSKRSDQSQILARLRDLTPADENRRAAGEETTAPPAAVASEDLFHALSSAATAAAVEAPSEAGPRPNFRTQELEEEEAFLDRILTAARSLLPKTSTTPTATDADATALLETTQPTVPADPDAERDRATVPSHHHLDEVAQKVRQTESALGQVANYVDLAKLRTTLRLSSQQMADLAHRFSRFLAMEAATAVVVRAPHDAEMLGGWLAADGTVDVLISNDGDAFAYGVPLLLSQFGFSRQTLWTTETAWRALGLESFEQFQDVCLLSGCDFTPYLPRLGVATVLKKFKRHGTLERVLEDDDAVRTALESDGVQRDAFAAARRILRYEDLRAQPTLYRVPDDFFPDGTVPSPPDARVVARIEDLSTRCPAPPSPRPLTPPEEGVEDEPRKGAETPEADGTALCKRARTPSPSYSGESRVPAVYSSYVSPPKVQRQEGTTAQNLVVVTPSSGETKGAFD